MYRQRDSLTNREFQEVHWGNVSDADHGNISEKDSML